MKVLKKETDVENAVLKRYNLKENWNDYVFIIAGTFLMAGSTNLFFTPANMVPGGFTGLSIILQYLTKKPVWMWNILFNIPLILIATKVRGWKFTRRTLIATLLFSLWLMIIPEMDITNHNLFLVSVIGGGLMGFGLGLVFSGKATTGGTDTLAAIFQRIFPYLNTARIMPLLDVVVIVIATKVFGIEVSLYAIIAVLISGRISDGVISGQKNASLAFIISDRHDDISYAITNEMNRGATLLSGYGTYTKLPRNVLLCAVNKRQTAILRDIVSDIDPKAFMILTEANEVRGQGFLQYSKEEL